MHVFTILVSPAFFQNRSHESTSFKHQTCSLRLAPMELCTFIEHVLNTTLHPLFLSGTGISFVIKLVAFHMYSSSSRNLILPMNLRIFEASCSQLSLSFQCNPHIDRSAHWTLSTLKSLETIPQIIVSKS